MFVWRSSIVCRFAFRRGIGDIVLVYKRVTNLASHTSRVSELLEQVGGDERERGREEGGGGEEGEEGR